MPTNKFSTRAAFRCGLLTWAILGWSIGTARAEPPSPGDSIDFTRWRLTIPVDRNQDGKADEVPVPETERFQQPEYLEWDRERGCLVFRAPCGGATTKGSSYPRSELREMLPGGEKRAAWSVADAAVHRLEARIAIDRLPKRKPHVVCLQMHDADDDVLMLRLEGTKLFLERAGEPDVPITKDYQLGQPFDFVLTAGRGKITATYNGQRVLEWDCDAKNCYFKAGCYTQSNVAKGDDPGEFASVAIFRLTISETSPTIREGRRSVPRG